MKSALNFDQIIVEARNGAITPRPEPDCHIA